MEDCMQFLSENRLNGCQIFGRFGFYKQNPNRISVFRTSVPVKLILLRWCNHHRYKITKCKANGRIL